MPQNLEETEFPGASPKGAVLFTKPRSKEVIAIAPIYSPDQAASVRRRGEELGLIFADIVTLYSPADLERVQTEDDLKVEASLRHSPGCIFASLDHPGTCYVDGSTT